VMHRHIASIDFSMNEVRFSLHPIKADFCMALLRYLFKMSWMTFSFASILSIVGGLFGAALIVVVNKGIANFDLRSSLAVLFFLFCTGHIVTKYCSEVLLLNLMQSAILRFRIELSNRLLATPLKTLQSLGRSNLLVILTQDIGTLALAFQAMSSLVGSLAVIAACFAYLAWLSWKIFCILVISVLVAAYCYYLSVRVSLDLFVKVRDKLTAVYSHFRSLVEGSKELQLNELKGTMFINSIVAPDAREYKTYFVRAMSSYMLIANLGTMFFYMVIGVTLFILPTWIAQASTIYVETILVLLYLTRPLSEIMSVLPILKQSNVSFEKIKRLGLSLSQSPIKKTDKEPFESKSPYLLEMRGITYQARKDEGSDFQIGPIDFRVNEGEILFILGTNGSGKTTLAMLLLGLYEPDEGEILFQGVPVTAQNLSQYRSYFSAVFADFYLFEYLLQAEDECLTEKASSYLELLEIGHKVKINDGKFSTIDLSTGQRKRLALVGAYLEDRSIYFFDEWAADQDPAFRKIFYTKLLPDLKERGKTVIIISHDDAYFSCADRIVRVVEGKILKGEVEIHSS
jgi:putative ATP-binding cassette transporter